MQDTATITLKLEAYLLQLSSTFETWKDWLNKKQFAAARLEVQKLTNLADESQGLIARLKDLTTTRQQILEAGAAEGFKASDLKGLARQLPAWKRPSLREAMIRAQLQIRDLQRLHIATWVLINESTNLFSGMVSVVAQGVSAQAVYDSGRNNCPDMAGGQLIDTDI